MNSLLLTGGGGTCEQAQVNASLSQLSADKDNGFSILEILTALAISAIVAAAGLAGLGSLAARLRLDSARTSIVQALTEARRQASSRAETIELAIGNAVIGPARSPAGSVRSAVVQLPVGTYVKRAPARGAIRFFASGLADNATVVVASTEIAGERSVVVNQRAMIK